MTICGTDRYEGAKGQSMSFCEETRKRRKIWIVEAVSLFSSATRETLWHLELQRSMSKCLFLLHFLRNRVRFEVTLMKNQSSDKQVGSRFQVDLPTSRVQICSRARSARGRFFMFSAPKAPWIIASESESVALGPEMRSKGPSKSLGFRNIRSCLYEIT